MGKSLLTFPEDKLAAAAKEINDYRVTVDALRSHFTKLRYIRLRRLEGARKAAGTRWWPKTQARCGEKKNPVPESVTGVPPVAAPWSGLTPSRRGCLK